MLNRKGNPMKKIYYKASMLALTTVLASAQMAHASSLDDNLVVRSTNGNIVHSLGSGKCVRATNWEAGYDICAPKEEAPAPAPVTVQQIVRTVLSTAEAIVFFDFNKATLTEQAKQQLDAVAAKLSAAADVQSADVVGYADRIGNAGYNQKLSEKRAEAVKWYLYQHGYVKTQVVTVQGVGESQSNSVCDPKLPRSMRIKCLSPDRKVELKLHYPEQVTQPVVVPVQPVATQPVVIVPPAAQ